MLIDENVAADATSSATSVQAVGSSIGCGDDTSSIQTLSIDLSKSHSLCRMITEYRLIELMLLLFVVLMKLGRRILRILIIIIISRK